MCCRAKTTCSKGIVRNGGGRSAPSAHDHLGTEGGAVVEVDHVDVAHADAAGRDGEADLRGLVGAVDAVEGVLVALEQVERPRAEGVLGPALHGMDMRP